MKWLIIFRFRNTNIINWPHTSVPSSFNNRAETFISWFGVTSGAFPPVPRLPLLHPSLLPAPLPPSAGVEKAALILDALGGLGEVEREGVGIPTGDF